jgi:tRNA(adenine34) deaminase
MDLFSDQYFMQEALKQANIAYQQGEIPVGAILVGRNRILGKGHNLTEQLKDVTAHAEIQAITAASGYLGAKYLIDCTLYVTLEPCIMCAGAIFWAQISKLVFGASDPKGGFTRINYPILQSRTQVVGGVLEKECSKILKDFFVTKR